MTPAHFYIIMWFRSTAFRVAATASVFSLVENFMTKRKVRGWGEQRWLLFV